MKLQNYDLPHMGTVPFKCQPDRPQGLAVRIIELFESENFSNFLFFCRRLTWLRLHAIEGRGVATQLMPMMAPGKMVIIIDIINGWNEACSSVHNL